MMDSPAAPAVGSFDVQLDAALIGSSGGPDLTGGDARLRHTVSPGLSVEADAGVLARWPKLPERVQQELTAREGIDPCARVELRRSGRSISIGMTLADGRTAARDVPDPDDVVPILEALLLLPRAASAVVAAEAPVAEPAQPAPTVRQPERRAPQPARAVAEEELAPRRSLEPSLRRLGFELSVVTGVGVGDGSTGMGLGALSFLDISGWLLGFEGRADIYTNMKTAQRQAVMQLVLLGGHRFRFGSAALDLVVGPALAVHDSDESAHSVPVGASSEAPPPNSSSSAWPRLHAASHLHLGARSLLRAFVGIDGELGPGGEQQADARLGPQPLPRWMLGLSLGATVGTR